MYAYICYFYVYLTWNLPVTTMKNIQRLLKYSYNLIVHQILVISLSYLDVLLTILRWQWRHWLIPQPFLIAKLFFALTILLTRTIRSSNILEHTVWYIKVNLNTILLIMFSTYHTHERSQLQVNNCKSSVWLNDELRLYIDHIQIESKISNALEYNNRSNSQNKLFWLRRFYFPN